MSAVPGCDSDEEVFWGPVTAKELEILWRYRMANNKQETRPETDPKPGSTDSHNKKWESLKIGTLQEVPSLQDLRKSVYNKENKLLEENVEYFVEKHKSELQTESNDSTWPLIENDILINNDDCIKGQNITVTACTSTVDDNIELKKFENYDVSTLEPLHDSSDKENLPSVLEGIHSEMKEVNLVSNVGDSKEDKSVISLDNKLSNEKYESVTSSIDHSGIIISKNDNSCEVTNVYSSNLEPMITNYELDYCHEMVNKADENNSLYENHSELMTNDQDISSALIVDSQNHDSNITENSEVIISKHGNLHEIVTNVDSINLVSLPDGDHDENNYSNKMCDGTEEKNSSLLVNNLEITSHSDTSGRSNVDSQNLNMNVDGNDINNYNRSSDIDNILPEKETSSHSPSHIIDEENSECAFSKSNILSDKPQESNSAVSDINVILDSHLDNIENIPPAQHIVHETSTCKTVEMELEKAKNVNLSEPVTAIIKQNHVLQEISLKKEDSCFAEVLSNEGDRAIEVPAVNSGSESSDEKSFVSLSNDEDNCDPNSVTQDLSSSSAIKNKENEDPNEHKEVVKSKIPITNLNKPPVLKPARLHHVPMGTNDIKWVNDLKRKKVPQSKKPDYMVSPAKLCGILKNRNQPPSQTKTNVDISTPSKSLVHVSLKPKLETPRSKLIPPKKKSNLTMLLVLYLSILEVVLEYHLLKAFLFFVTQTRSLFQCL